MGRQIQKRYEQEPQNIVTCPILVGLDGEDKMSKSLDNYIALTEQPAQMYGKLMAYADAMITNLLWLLTDISSDVIKEIEKSIKGGENPMLYKKIMAFEVVKLIKGKEQTQQAQQYFERTVQKKETPEEVRIKKLEVRSKNIVDLLIMCDLVSSKSEARRLIEQNGVKVDGHVVQDLKHKVSITQDGVLLQRGKRQFVRVIRK